MPVAIFFLTVDCHGAMTLSQRYGGFFVGGGVGGGGAGKVGGCNNAAQLFSQIGVLNNKQKKNRQGG